MPSRKNRLATSNASLALALACGSASWPSAAGTVKPSAKAVADIRFNIVCNDQFIFFQQMFHAKCRGEKAPRVAACRGGNTLGRAFGHDSAAIVAAFRPQIKSPNPPT